MLRKIRLVPLAAESLGTRSMCTYLETPNLRILLDAGVSLCPSRFKLPPHPREFEAIKNARRNIAKFAKRADVVTISHYHFDHHTPSYEDWLCNWTEAETAQQIYGGKIVLAKNYRTKVNASQRKRGWIFEKTGGKHAEKLEFADGRIFSFGETKLRFSRPVCHGLPNTPLGWVLMTTIDYCDERVMFTSDVQGPIDDATLPIILAEKPQVVIIGGPPLYLADFRVSEQQIHRGIRNLQALGRKISTVVLEHHLLRDAKWRDESKQVFEAARDSGNKVVTAAEFLGEEDRLLEARRKQLFEEEPPNSDFEHWSRLPEFERKKTQPPL